MGTHEQEQHIGSWQRHSISRAANGVRVHGRTARWVRGRLSSHLLLSLAGLPRVERDRDADRTEEADQDSLENGQGHAVAQQSVCERRAGPSPTLRQQALRTSRLPESKVPAPRPQPVHSREAAGEAQDDETGTAPAWAGKLLRDLVRDTPVPQLA